MSQTLAQFLICESVYNYISESISLLLIYMYILKIQVIGIVISPRIKAVNVYLRQRNWMEVMYSPLLAIRLSVSSKFENIRTDLDGISRGSRK